MPLHVRVRLGALVALVVAVVVLAVVIDVPSVAQLRRDYSDTGVAGGLGFALLYAALTLLPLPASVFTLAAGAVFGVGTGSVIVWVGACLGAVVAFVLGRLLGRDVVSHLTGTRLDTMNAYLESRGTLAVLVARLIPVVPYAAFNYLAGLTGLRLRSYTLGTAIGIVPGVVVYAALGAYGNRPGSWPFLTALAVLVVLVVVAAVGGHRRRRRRSAAQPARRAQQADAGPDRPAPQ